MTPRFIKEQIHNSSVGFIVTHPTLRFTDASKNCNRQRTGIRIFIFIYIFIFVYIYMFGNML